MPVVGCSQHLLNSLSESFSSLLIKSFCKGEATGFLLVTGGSSYIMGVGDDVIFPVRSGGDGRFERLGIVSSDQKVGFQAHFMVYTPRAGLFRE